MKKKAMVLCTCGVISALVACVDNSNSTSDTKNIAGTEINETLSTNLLDKTDGMTNDVSEELTTDKENSTEKNKENYKIK